MKKEGITVLLSLCLLLTACQPTPEEEIVTNRGDGIMEQKIFVSGVPSQEVMPEDEAKFIEKTPHWAESFNVNENLSVEIDCDVRWGEDEAYYVEKCEAAEFTPEMVVTIGNAFFGDVTGLREQEVSYDELLNELLELERGYYNGKDDNGDPIWLPHDEAYKNDHTAEIRAQMEKTPAVSTYVPFAAENIHMTQISNPLTVQRKDGKEGKMYVTLGQNSNDLCCRVYVDGSARRGSLLRESPIKEPKPSITEEEAIETADMFLTSIGLSQTECSNAEVACWGTVSEAYSEGWYLQYGPVLNGTRGVGLFGRSKNCLFQSSELKEYSQSLRPESYELYVTENGIEYFEWNCPYAIKEVVNENVEILPFSSIQESMRKYFHLAFAWADNPSSTGTEKLIVKDVVLTSAVVHVKNDMESAYRIPTWAIFYLGDDEERMNLYSSVMLINAIDGTLIRGYSD